jgi:hypothetical protein
VIGNPYKGRGFKGLLRYLFEGRKDDPNPHRVEWHVTRNIAIDDPDALPAIMRASASLSTRVRKPVYHLPISWPPDEQLDRATQLAIVDELLADLGLSEHECVIVAHNDGQCPHVHLVVNRVHPHTGKVWNAWRDVYRIMDSLERQERQRGLRIVDRRDLDEWREGRSDEDRKREASRGERLRAEREGDQPLAPWSEGDMRDVRNAVTRHFRDARSWEDLEARLRKHGLELRRAGQGFRLTDGKRFMTLSKIGKHAHWQLLEERFACTWDDYEATRPLTAREQSRLEPPGALSIMRAEADRGSLQSDQRLREAWQAHLQYEGFRHREKVVAQEGRKLILLKRKLYRNEDFGVRVHSELVAAQVTYAQLFQRIYRNPVETAERLKEQLRAGKEWDRIDLRTIGKLRADFRSELNSARPWKAERAMKRVRPLFERRWRLESLLESATHEWHTLQAGIAAQERLFGSGVRDIGPHEQRGQQRSELYRKREKALRRINAWDIEHSSLPEESKRFLADAMARHVHPVQRSSEWKRDRSREWDRGR